MESTAAETVTTTITVFDWCVISIIGLSGLLALFRGFIREILSLAAWVTAAVVTFNCWDNVMAFLEPRLTSKVAIYGLSTVGLYIGVLVAMAIINTIIMRFLQAGGDISILDSMLGMVFGITRGLFVVGLGYLMLMVVIPEDNYPDWLKQSRTRPFVEATARILSSLAPNYVEGMKSGVEAAKVDMIKSAQQKAMETLQQQMMQQQGAGGQQKQPDLNQMLKTLNREPVPPAQGAPEKIAPGSQ